MMKSLAVILCFAVFSSKVADAAAGLVPVFLPEPASGVLLLGGLIAMLWRTRSR
jgi:hypothetical protein